jgi:ribulose-5-phosphate 4-epimerase/fuculose-1-phosphate aldolase
MSEAPEHVLRQQIVDCTRMLVMEEVMDYSGHVSARIPGTDRILIQPRDTSRVALTVDDILVVGLDGTVLEGDEPPPSETALHLGVYRARSDIMAVCHGHPPMATLFTMVDRPMVAARNFGFRFINTPILDDPTHIRTDDQARAVADAIGSGRACLLRAHGTAVAALSVPELFMDCVEMEENARSVVQACTLGTLKPITDAEAEELRVSFGKNDYRVAKIWEHNQQKARMAGYL